MKRSALKKLKLYPHFKLTDEQYPRLLVTRKIENDGAEYFGAFLPKTGARVLLGFVNKIFKLRSCEIDIKQGLPIPCPMFYRERCLAPCVANICDEEQYAKRVELLRLFLSDKRTELKTFLTDKINASSENLDFENAAEWRDFMFQVETIWNGKRSQFWQGKTIDTWDIAERDSEIVFNLVSQRGRKILGSRSFLFQKDSDEDASQIAKKVLLHFYKIYLPKEIRVFKEFGSRKIIAEKLSKRFGRDVKILIQNELTPTTKKGLRLNKIDTVINNLSDKKSFRDILKQIRKSFKLKKIPGRIEAYDVAHISGANVVTAKIVWENGKFLTEKNEVWQFEGMSEPQAITEAIRQRFNSKRIDVKTLPELILIDGGTAQLNAALNGITAISERMFKIISAVKPSGKHKDISHFLDESLNRIEIADEETRFFLINLRDRSHDLANRTHSSLRDTNHFYELAVLLPNFSEKERRKALHKAGSIRSLRDADLAKLKSIFDSETADKIYIEIRRVKNTGSEEFATRIIPIRFDAEDGNAKDLEPVDYRTPV